MKWWYCSGVFSELNALATTANYQFKATVQQKTFKENQNHLVMRNYGNFIDTINNSPQD